MKSCILLDRSLNLYRAMHPEIEAQQTVKTSGKRNDPNMATGVRPYLAGYPILYSERVATMAANGTLQRTHVSVADVVRWCVQTMARSLEDPECPHDQFRSWAAIFAYCAEDDSKVLAMGKMVVLHRLQMPSFLVSSELSCKRLLREGNSEASSYCLAHIPQDTGEKQLLPCHVKYFILMEWQLSLPTNRMAVVCPIPLNTSEEEGDAFGQTVFRFDKSQLPKIDPVLIPVQDIVRPCILIKTPPRSPRCMWRLVQFQGKLLGSFEQRDCWE